LNNNAIGGSKGFFGGGFSGANLATVDKVTYSTDTTNAQTTANLSQARSSLASCSGDGTKGYFADQSITDVLVYFSEKTNAIASANLSSARSNFCGISQGSSKGYFAGGQIAAYLTTTDKLTYSNNTTAAQTTADLSQETFWQDVLARETKDILLVVRQVQLLLYQLQIRSLIQMTLLSHKQQPI